MTTLTICQSRKSIELVNSIIESEDLEVTVTYDVTTALGDTVIVIKGEAEEVNTLNEIYNMVK